MKKGNLGRLRELSAHDGLDGVIGFSGDHIRYMTGYRPPGCVPPSGIYLALLPCNEALGPAMLVTDFDEVWARRESEIDDIRTHDSWAAVEDRHALESGRAELRRRPVQYDWRQIIQQVRELLGDRNLLGAQIGCELDSLPIPFRESLFDALPDVTWKDASTIFWQAQMIKTDDEITTIRQCARLAELGMSTVMLESDPRGKTVSQVRNEFDLAIRNSVARDGGLQGFQNTRIFMSAGGNIGTQVGRNEDLVTEGSVVWIDCAVNIDGYECDIGRTFQVGQQSSALTSKIATALVSGGDAGMGILRPGLRHSELFKATQGAIQSAGLSTYYRGHVGHAIGPGSGEFPPFISEEEEQPFLPGMVFAYECPYYVKGLGGFQFEDDILMHEDGFELLTTLPRQLFRI